MENKIFAYMRISTNHKTQKVDRQQQTLIEYSVKNGFKIDDFFSDIIKTALALRKLKDGDGNYLWNHANDTILGRQVIISEYMPDIETGTKPIAFGDFSYYWIVGRKPVTVRTLLEKFVLYDQIGYLAFEYLDSWKLEPTDKLPKGKKPCLSLRELEKQVNTDLDLLVNIVDGQMTVCELVDRYLKTKTGVRQSTKQGYVTVQRLLAKETFGKKTIRSVKTSDAKLFLIKLQQEDGKSYSSIHTIRGVLRPAFQMAVDDDILVKNPFGFQLAGVLVNDAVTREAITKDQMRKFLKFVHDDVVYCKYYEVVYILFHTGMRISEFCGLTLKDIDLENRTVNIDHQLQRTSDMRYIIETTKTDAGTRVLPITEDVAQMFQAIIEDRNAPKVEKTIDGYSGFLFYDDKGMPLVAMHWQHRFNHMVGRYNDIYRVQMPNITPHVCRHTYCSNMAKSGMSPKTLQYLMGHSDISVTMNVYTHIGFDDAEEELKRMEEFRKAQAEVEQKKEKPMSQKMFKVI